MEYLVLLGVVITLMALVFALLGIKVLFHKSHKFPETSAGHNKEMRKRGVNCPRHEEIKAWSKKGKKTACASCYEHARECC